MDEKSINDIPYADHQHLQSQEREQEFVEEEKFMADKASFKDIRTRKQEMIQNIEKLREECLRLRQEQSQIRREILEIDRTCEQGIQRRESNFSQIDQDFWTRRQEIFQKREKTLEDIRTREQGIQRRETKLDQSDQDYWITVYERLKKIDYEMGQIYQDLLTLQQKLIQRDEQILEDIRTCMQERIKKRESNFSRIYLDFLIKDKPDADHQHLQSQDREQEFVEEEKFNPSQIVQDFQSRWQEQELLVEYYFPLTPEDFWTPMQERVQKSEKHFSLTPEDFRTHIPERTKKSKHNFLWIPEDFRTREQERIQKRENKTTETTKLMHSTITSLLLVSVFVASRICSVGADFIPVESDLSLCKTDLSKLADTCDHNEGKAIHCVLNDKGELGIGCFLKTWVKQGYCPYYRNSFGVLDIRPCLGNSSICPRDQYLSNEVYKYPGCLINNSTRVPDILATHTTQSTTVRSSDAGDEESLLQIWAIVFLGLFSLFLLLIVGLGVLRWKTITSRGLSSAFAPAFMDHQDPQGDGVDV